MSAGHSTTTERHWLCPLYSFGCFSESIELAEGIEIKRKPRAFAEYLSRESNSSFFRTYPDEVEWVASLPSQANTIMSSDINELIRIGLKAQDRVRDLLVDLITALRFCHEGRVIAGPLIATEIRDSKQSFGDSIIWTPVSNIWFFQEEPKYALRQTDVSEVDNLLQNIRNWRQSGVLDSVDVALRRFHSAYHGNIEDRIIDQMIAFESLYLGGPQELTYKLALRVAFFLGKGEDKRKVIFENMKKAYKYRSRIVHGDNPPNRDKLSSIVPKVEDYLRQSLRRFLLLLSGGKMLKEIREQLLDENILKNGGLLAFEG